jgi:hypothetical protein
MSLQKVGLILVCGALGGTSAAVAVGFCTQTADTLLEACRSSVRDDGSVTSAVCLNISDRSERDACFDDLAGAREEGNQLCDDQHATRLAACGLLGEDRYDPDLDPARFDNPKRPSKPNPYFPMTVGHRWEFVSQTQTDVVEVVNETKLIEGVTCIVFRDLVSEGGQIHEATDDWYVPAKDGSVWYFGEEVKDYERFRGDRPSRPELVSIDGSFKVGRNGDKPGIIALASPAAGDVYLEEFSLGNAEDVTEVLSATYAYGHDADLDRSVPRGLAERLCGAGDCVVTKNYSLLEPGLFARKYSARGIGVFLEIENTGEVVRLVNCNFDARCASLPRR